jgi:hypothetical protein
MICWKGEDFGLGFVYEDAFAGAMSLDGLEDEGVRFSQGRKELASHQSRPERLFWS